MMILKKGDCVRMKKRYQRQPWGTDQIGVITAAIDDMIAVAMKPKTIGEFVAAEIYTRAPCPRWAKEWKKDWRPYYRTKRR